MPTLHAPRRGRQAIEASDWATALVVALLQLRYHDRASTWSTLIEVRRLVPIAVPAPVPVRSPSRRCQPHLHAARNAQVRLESMSRDLMRTAMEAVCDLGIHRSEAAAI